MPEQTTDDGSQLLARVRELLATQDRAIPTMELSLALGVSAQLASRLLGAIEKQPNVTSLVQLHANIERPDARSEDKIVNARGWDDAVNQVTASGADPAVARATVDWVILEMAIAEWIKDAHFHRAAHELAALAGVAVQVAAAEGLAATLRRIVAAGPVDRLAATRAFVIACSLGFEEAFKIGDALATETERRKCATLAEQIDAGDVEGAERSLSDGLGLTAAVATRAVAALSEAFASARH